MPASLDELRLSAWNRGARAPSPNPSPRVLRAALTGLMAAGSFGCSDSNDDNQAERSDENLTDEQLRSMCADLVDEAKHEAQAADDDKASESSSSGAASDLDALCADRVQEAKDTCEKPDADSLCKEMVADAKSMCPEPEKPDAKTFCADAVKDAVAKATAPVAPDDKVTDAEQKEYTFAELTQMCDERGGYVEVHASCGGVNSCKGFSFGDWGPGAATLTEHSCSGANGCAGLSCVVLPEDKHPDKTDAELYDAMFADTEPSSCTNCHAPHDDDGMPDLGKFNVFVYEGSTRDASNWLERSAAEQERVVAFGAHTVLPEGIAMQNMAAYHKVLSRTEIERLVAHIRTLDPVIKVMKTQDPEPAGQ